MNRKEVTRKGSLFVVTAPSGPGKTSLIKALSRPLRV
jgi:guanylate kinase